MSDLDPPKLLLATSVIFEAVFGEDFSSRDARNILKMGANRLANLWVGHDVLRHAESVFRKRSENEEQGKIAAATVAAQLVVCRIGTAARPSEQTVEACRDYSAYEPAARALATAIEIDCEVLVSSDWVNLLKNPKIGPPNTRFVVMGPREAF